MADHAAIHARQQGDSVAAQLAAQVGAVSWTSRYLRRAAVADDACALVAGLLALQVRFADHGHPPVEYLALSLSLPLLWLICLALAGGYDSRSSASAPMSSARC